MATPSDHSDRPSAVDRRSFLGASAAALAATSAAGNSSVAIPAVYLHS